MEGTKNGFPLDLLSEGSKRTTFDERVAEDMKQLIDDSNFTKYTVMEKDDDKNGEVSFTELLNTIEAHDTTNRFRYENYKIIYIFPYENYKIIGDTAEIDKIIYAEGYINIDVRDIEKILSNKTTNYVSTGSAEGAGCIANALKDAVSKLPITIDRIADLLFNIWVPKTMDSPLKELNSMTEFIGGLSGEFKYTWGVAYDDESLNGQQAKITLIAASK